MQAITTKYHPLTNHRDPRISATTTMGIRRYYPFNSHGEYFDSHVVAARALCRELDWKGEIVAGALKKGYVFVFVTSRGNEVDRYKVGKDV